MYNVVKTLRGEVLVMQGGFVIYELDRMAWVRINGLGVAISDTSGQKVNLLLADISTTQVMPAEAIAAPLTASELLTLFNTSFFENVATIGGSGGEISENQTEVTTGTYNVLASDKNIVCTGDCTVVLPDTASGSFALRVWASDGVTVSVKGQVGQTVMGEVDLMLYGGEMITFMNLLGLPDWRAGQ